MGLGSLYPPDNVVHSDINVSIWALGAVPNPTRKRPREAIKLDVRIPLKHETAVDGNKESV